LSSLKLVCRIYIEEGTVVDVKGFMRV